TVVVVDIVIIFIEERQRAHPDMHVDRANLFNVQYPARRQPCPGAQRIEPEIGAIAVPRLVTCVSSRCRVAVSAAISHIHVNRLAGGRIPAPRLSRAGPDVPQYWYAWNESHPRRSPTA